jgi:hypothetical protein
MLKTKFSYVQTIRRRNQLYEHVFAQQIGNCFDAGALNTLTDAALNYLPQRTAKNAVYESLRVFAGTQITPRLALEIAWRLSGNVLRLIDDIPVLPWTQQTEDELVPVRVEHVSPARRKDKSGYYFSLRCVGGSPCPIEFSHFVSRVAAKVLSRTVGFSGNTWGKHPYAGVAQHFSGLLFFAHVEAERSRDKPYFHQVSASSGMLKHNKELLDVRCRAKPCPLEYRHNCVDCHIGTEDCVFSTHRQTYDVRYCNSCQKDAFFDPKSPAMLCIRCQHVLQ